MLSPSKPLSRATRLATSLALMVRVCECNIIFPYVRPSVHPLLVHLSVTLSSKPLGRIQPNCNITSPHGMGNAILFFGASIFHLPSICRSCYLLLSHRQNSTKLPTSLPFIARVCESNIIYLCVCLSLRRRPSICPSRYLLNHLAESNQTCYITSPHGKGVHKQNYFSVHPLSILLFVTLSPPKPLGGIQPNLQHHSPVCGSNIYLCVQCP